MAKRVSVKGRGADIFFGEYSPDAPSEVPAAQEAETPILPTSEDENSAPTSEQQASMQESKHARKRAVKQASEGASTQASTLAGGEQVGPAASQVLDAIWEEVTERATITNAFRYTEPELSGLTDALYEITKRHGVKLSKQDVARLGLNAVLWDYRMHGDESLLGQLVLRKKHRRKRE